MPIALPKGCLTLYATLSCAQASLSATDLAGALRVATLSLSLEIAEYGGNTSDTNHEDDDSLAEDEPSCKHAHIEDSHDFNKSISRQHTNSPPVTSHTHKGKNIPRD
jgi:hypothetical protein